MDYITVLYINLTIFRRGDKSPEEVHREFELKGMVPGDPLALVNQLLTPDLIKGAHWVTGESWIIVHDKLKDGSKGRIVLQKRTIYDRRFQDT
jgi:hypothetical protein